MGFGDGSYRVLAHKKFEKIVRKKLPSHLVKVLDRKIDYLKNNPRHPSLNTKPLHVAKDWCQQRGINEVFEFRITKSFRCIFYVIHEQREIILAFAGNHEDIKKHVQ